MVAMMRASISRHQPRRKRRQQHRDDAGGRRHQARPGGGVAELGLQPERHQQMLAKNTRIAQAEGQRAQREIAALEQRQVDDRMLLGQLPDQEGGEADRGDDGQRPRSAVEANQSASLPVSSMTCSAPTQTTSRPSPTVSIGSLRVGVSRLCRLRPAQERHDQAHRHIDQEDPAPVDNCRRYSRPGSGRRSAPPGW